VAVGQYSEESSLQPGIDAIKALPGVDAAAGIYDVSSDARVDGVHVPLQAYAVYVGHPEPVMVSGHAPHRPDEIALGRATADRLGKHTGDRVRITNLDGSVDIGDVTVTGIAVLANAVNSAANAGDGAYVTSDVAHQLSPAVAQSIAIRVRPGPTRQATLDRLTAAFPGSIRPASPQADLRNLVRLRSVPWLLASLIGALTLAAVSHVLFGLFRRHRGDLAILGATGLTRRQRLQVMGVSAGWLVLVGIAVGLPVGVVGARVVWQSLAERISIPAHPVVSLPEAGLVVVGVLLLGLSIALVAGRWQQRRTPAAILRTE
jgi:putative ABC transport system permease protein